MHSSTPLKQYIFMHSSTHNLSNSTSSCTAQRTTIQTAHLHNLSNSTSPCTAHRTVFQTVHLHAQLSAHPFSQSSVMHSSTHSLSNSTSSCTAQCTRFQSVFSHAHSQSTISQIVHLHAQLSAHPFSQSASRTACRARASSFQREGLRHHPRETMTKQ